MCLLLRRKSVLGALTLFFLSSKNGERRVLQTTRTSDGFIEEAMVSLDDKVNPEKMPNLQHMELPLRFVRRRGWGLGI